MADAGIQVSETQQEKDRLELEKLHLEIQRLQHPIRTSIREFGWKDVAAIVVAVAGILLAWLTGVFNVAKERVAVSTERLQIEKAQLEEGNAELVRTKAALQRDAQELEKQLLALKNETGSYKKETAAIKAIAGIRKASDGSSPKHDIWTNVSLENDGEGFGVQVYRYVSRDANGKGDPDSIVEPLVTELIDRLREIPRLVSLQIRNFELSQQDVQRIGILRQLKKLSLHRNHLSDEMLEPISGMTDLIELSITGNSIKRPKLLARLSRLERLSLRRTPLDDDGLALLTPLRHTLVRLWLPDTQITDSGIKHLNEFRKLNRLWITGTKITPGGFTQLDMPELRNLFIGKDDLPQPQLELLRKKTGRFLPDINWGPDWSWEGLDPSERIPDARDFGQE